MEAKAPDVCSNQPFPRRAWLAGLSAAAIGAAAMAGCNTGGETVFTRLADARAHAADVRLNFNKAADASNRSVMADTDQASIAFAAEAEEAKGAVRRDVGVLRALLQALGYAKELEHLAAFEGSFADYERQDGKILELAVANSNLKAQRLSFVPAREAADAFCRELESLWRAAAPKDACRVGPQVHTAVVSLREIQVLQAPHIAEKDDTAMTALEKQMDVLEASARSALRALFPLAVGESAGFLGAAVAALDRFVETNKKIVALSRQNTNVRSLQMSLGEKRAAITACDGSLAALQGEIAKEKFTATR
jgi:hypothetical protein